MKTDVLKADKENIEIASEVIKDGGIIIFPTETVYGMATNAKNEAAVRRIFSIKGRNENKPLSIFIPSAEEISHFADIAPENEKIYNKLSSNFWPGPLTMIFPKKDIIPDIVTAGKRTVGIRIPAHGFALALIKKIAEPMVVTSANISGHDPAKGFEDAADLFFGKVDMILDGGRCGSEMASTVIEIINGNINILREGEISKDKISDILQ